MSLEERREGLSKKKNRKRGVYKLLGGRGCLFSRVHGNAVFKEGVIKFTPCLHTHLKH